MKKILSASIATNINDLFELATIEALAIKDMGFQHIGDTSYAIMQGDDLIVYSREYRNFTRYYRVIDFVDELISCLVYYPDKTITLLNDRDVKVDVMEFRDLFEQ